MRRVPPRLTCRAVRGSIPGMGELARRLASEADPVRAAVLAAPLAEEPETEEEREAIAAIKADIAAGGHGHTPDEVQAVIEQMRRDHGE